MAKQLGMKAMGLIGEKIVKSIGDLVTSAASSINDIITRLIHEPKPTRVILPVTEQMPPIVAKTVNDSANKK